jgi:hypothetical protein
MANSPEANRRLRLIGGESHGNAMDGHAFHCKLMTHREIAQQLGITRQAVAAAERRALWKLRIILKPLHDELIS